MPPMIQFRPSNPTWDGLAPLIRQIEALGRVLEVCVTYYTWFVGCAAGVALLLLGGLVVAESTDKRGELTLLPEVMSRLRNWVGQHLGRLSEGPSETTPTEH
jgi:hypothetical protein